MGKRGPLPLKQEEKWLQGSSTSRPRDKTEQQEIFMPRMPSGLSGQEQSVWRSLVPRIAALQMLNPTDSVALVDLCRCIVRLEEAERDISERGLLVDGDRGKVKNPSCQLARTYREALQKWCQRFGLTPSDRDRLELPEAEQEPDPLELFLSRRREPSNKPE